jgi:hypothetical protein
LPAATSWGRPFQGCRFGTQRGSYDHLPWPLSSRSVGMLCAGCSQSASGTKCFGRTDIRSPPSLTGPKASERLCLPGLGVGLAPIKCLERRPRLSGMAADNQEPKTSIPFRKAQRARMRAAIQQRNSPALWVARLTPRPFCASFSKDRRRWWIVWTLLFSTAINYVNRQTLSVLAPVISNQFHLTHTQLSNIFGAFQFAYAGAWLIGGIFLDVAGTRLGLSSRWSGGPLSVC